MLLKGENISGPFSIPASAADSPKLRSLAFFQNIIVKQIQFHKSCDPSRPRLNTFQEFLAW